MTLEDALRWKRALWFLALDLWQPYSQALWIGPEKAKSLRDDIRKAASSAGFFPASASDPREWIYDILNALQSQGNRESYFFCLDWQQYVFIDRGNDRVAELWWIWLSRSLAQPEQKIWLSPEIYEAIVSCCKTMARDFDTLQTLAKEPEMAFTTWDKEAIDREGSSQQDVLNTLQVIAGRNSFCQAWQTNCSARGQLFLRETFEKTKVFIDEGNPGIQLTSEELPFPSSWEFSYLKFNPLWR